MLNSFSDAKFALEIANRFFSEGSFTRGKLGCKWWFVRAVYRELWKPTSDRAQFYVNGGFEMHFLPLSNKHIALERNLLLEGTQDAGQRAYFWPDFFKSYLHWPVDMLQRRVPNAL